MIGCDCATCRSDRSARQAAAPVRLRRDRRRRARARRRRARPARAGAAHDIRRVDAHPLHARPRRSHPRPRRGAPLQRAAAAADAVLRRRADARRHPPDVPYVFDPATPTGGGLPQLELFAIGGPFCVGRHEVMPVPILHGQRPILGFRFGAFAYLTDCNRIPDESWPLLEDLDVARHRRAARSAAPDALLAVAKRSTPRGASARRRTYFTHMCHDLPHAETCARLPPGWSWPMMG